MKLYYQITYLLISFGILVSTAAAGSFSVPVILTPAISIGYDSNILKFSDEEFDRAETDLSLLGDSDTFDSGIIKPEMRISYSPYIFGENETKFSFWGAFSNYSQSQNKNYSSWSFRLEQHLGPYSWLKLYYSQMPEFYLRTYGDRDYISDVRQDCQFSYESYHASISYPILHKTWLQVKALAANEYYNELFTEFDTEKTGLEIRISSLHFKKLKISAWGETGSADNTTFDSGLFSNLQDRSYDYLEYGGSIRYSVKCWVKDITLSYNAHLREYHADDPDDPLHSGREHLDRNLALTVNKALAENWNLQFSYKYRNKFTESQYEWVEDLKSFDRHQLWLKFSYRFYSDFLY